MTRDRVQIFYKLKTSIFERISLDRPSDCEDDLEDQPILVTK